jgi:hypothetical protein
MPATNAPMSWGMILAITAGVVVVTGMVLGGLYQLLGAAPGFASVGAPAGIVAAFLIMRRRMALAAQAKAAADTRPGPAEASR